MSIGERINRAVEKASQISGRSWKDNTGLIARIAEIPFCFGVFVNAAINMADRGKEKLNPATDGLIMYSLVLSMIAILWCGITMGVGALKKFFHWPGDLFLVLSFGIIAGMYTSNVETACSNANPHIWDWSQLLRHDVCNKAKADYAFAFMTTMAFVLSTAMGLLMAYDTKSWAIRQKNLEKDIITDYADDHSNRNQA